MATETKDELGDLIRASNHAPLPWGQQQKLINLFINLLERTEVHHNIQIEKLQHLMKNMQENVKILKSFTEIKENAYRS